MNGTCGECRFWHDNGSGKRGVCKRFPPTVICQIGNNVESFWPSLPHHAECGEFKINAICVTGEKK